jgi:hypothetical protein
MQRAMANVNAAFEQIARASTGAFENTGKPGSRPKK